MFEMFSNNNNKLFREIELIDKYEIGNLIINENLIIY